MNNIKLTMDNYFNGLNLSLIRRQLNSYRILVNILEEDTLSNLVDAITINLNVRYEGVRISVAMGFLNDYVSEEISECTLFHCLIGACDTYSNDLPEEVLRVSHMVLEAVYNGEFITGDAECENDCPDCKCEHKKETSYDLPTIIKGILQGDATIMDGDTKVPGEVVLTVARFMDETGLDRDELINAISKGGFEGKVMDSKKATIIKVLKSTDFSLSNVEPKQTLIDKEAIRKAMKDTEKEKLGAFERMKKASEALEGIGVDVEGMLIKLVLEKAHAEGVSMTNTEAEVIVKAVMNGSI